MNTVRIMSRQMRLSELLRDEVSVPERLDRELTGIELDSRRIDKGDLFFACKGANFDGREFIDEVIARGASAVLVEAGEAWSELSVKNGVPVIPLDKLACRIGKIAARFFDYPAASLWMIGITGTNGKTSCCQFIAQSYTALGSRCGVSGTLGSGIYGESLDSDPAGPGTTPDAISVQRILEEVRFRHGKVMAMEVSSHGLRQNRVDVNEFDVALFTNLSRDHLDYHGSMEAYGESKRKLFSSPQLKLAVLNQDDMYSATILNGLARSVKSYTYSLSGVSASVHPRRLDFHPAGFSMDVVTPWGEGRIDSPLLGSFNAGNLLATLTVVLAGEAQKPGFDFAHILEVVSGVSPVRGRMEVVGREAVTVVVDYAHTPDGLKNALEALRQHFPGRIWCVFGCGGDRDKGKRPLMAQIAEQLADRVVITDDNPRREPSAEIIRQILSGIARPGEVIVESDRGAAIDLAIGSAGEGDVVLLAGKGHEDYQDVGGNRMAFSDVKQARLSLNKRFQTGAQS